jgi:hypothetical protein
MRICCRTESEPKHIPEVLDDYLATTTPVRAIDVFIDELRLGDLSFDGVQQHSTGRPAYHPAMLFGRRQCASAPWRRAGHYWSTPLLACPVASLLGTLAAQRTGDTFSMR